MVDELHLGSPWLLNQSPGSGFTVERRLSMTALS